MAGAELSLVEAALAQAKELRRRKDFSAAAEILLDVLRLGVQTDRVFFQLGNVFFDGGDLSRAEYAYRRATEVNPEHVNALHNLAVVYRRQGKVAESVKLQRKTMILELRRRPRGEQALPPEMARRARWAGLQGMLVVGVILALIALWLYR